MAYKNVEDRRAYHKKYMRERRELYRRIGLCTECGNEDAYTIAGHPRCFEHTHYRRKTPIEYIKDVDGKPHTFYPPGSCYRCGNPVKQGVTEWGGEPYKVCDRCYEQIVAMSEKGRKRTMETHGRSWGQIMYDFEHSQRPSVSANTAKSLPPNGQ